jgi:RNA polymerase sigma factor for flagellar operon FliA
VTAAPVPCDQAPLSVDELVRTHVPLVGHLVRELLNRLPSHVSRDELVSAGLMALVVSAQKYDPSRGVPFANFAAIRIRGALTDELRSMDWASRAVRGKARDVEMARSELAARLDRAPTRDEVASVLGVSVRDVDAVESDVARASLLSLQGLSPDNGAELLPTKNEGPESMLLRREEIGLLHDAIAELPDRLRAVVVQYFFEQRKMIDIAADLGVTESRVSQLRSEALGLLRACMRQQDNPEAKPAPSARRPQVRDSYCAAVAAHSTLTGRLGVTTLLGDVRVPLREPCAIAS